MYYRLNAGEFPYATSVFPIGFRKGSGEVALRGFNLGGELKLSVAGQAIQEIGDRAAQFPVLVTTAIGLHQSGQRGPAAPLYQKILVQQQDNASALHLLGVLHNQQGQRARHYRQQQSLHGLASPSQW